MKIHEQLKAARIKRGWSQQQLADKISRAAGTRERIANIERGAIEPKANTIEQIADILGYTVTLKQKRK